MTNLINTYSEKIDLKEWQRLNELIQSCEIHLRELIDLDDKPKRQQKAHKALENLKETLSDYLQK